VRKPLPDLDVLSGFDVRSDPFTRSGARPARICITRRGWAASRSIWRNFCARAPRRRVLTGSHSRSAVR